ncbi:MAG TPA: hypothetical protein VGF23_03530 [Gaiellaceae bacterium]
MAIILLSLLFVLWLVSLFTVLVDTISVGAKLVWLLALTLLAPIAIPLYFWLRHRRRRDAAPAGSSA